MYGYTTLCSLFVHPLVHRLLGCSHLLGITTKLPWSLVYKCVVKEINKTMQSPEVFELDWVNLFHKTLYILKSVTIYIGLCWCSLFTIYNTTICILSFSSFKKTTTVEQISVPIIQQRGKSKFNFRKSNKNARLHLLRFTKFT